MLDQYLSSDLKAIVSDQNFVFVVEYNFFKDSPPIYSYGKFSETKRATWLWLSCEYQIIGTPILY